MVAPLPIPFGVFCRALLRKHYTKTMGDFIQVPRDSGGRNFHRGGGRWNNHHNNRGGGRGRGRGRGGRFHRGNHRGGGGRPQHYDTAHDRIEILGKPSPTSLNIAIEGCCHGELEMIYSRLEAHEKQTGQKVDLLICCGDFQSHRNPADFHSSSIPPKYRRLGTFPKYYSGEKKAPILTLFIGGNHEASQPLRELYYGGWAAPNIYYMGAAGVVRYGGIRIGGMSGIYKSHDYEMGHFERPPFDRNTLRSVYHVRNVDIYRMKCLSKSKTRVDMIVSHDWPLGIEQHGNTEELLRQKPFFRAEVERNDLGSPPSRQVLDVVQPKWWFSAHLHVKFMAIVKHKSSAEDKPRSVFDPLVPSQVIQTKRAVSDAAKVPPKEPSQEDSKHDDNTTDGDSKVVSEAVKSPPKDQSQEDSKEAADGESNAALEQAATSPPKEPSKEDSKQTDSATDGDLKETKFHGLESSCTATPDLTYLMTKFLALDKCLPRRQYLSILHLENGCSREDACLEYDPEWLAILRKTHKLTCTERQKVKIPNELEGASEEEISWVEARLKERNSKDDDKDNEFRRIPLNFQPTVPFYSDPCFQSPCPPLPHMGNPQTDWLLDLLDIEHTGLTIPFDARNSLTPESISAFLMGGGGMGNSAVAQDENEIEIDLDDPIETKAETDEADENEIDLDGVNDHDSTEKAGAADDASIGGPKTETNEAAADENEIELPVDGVGDPDGAGKAGATNDASSGGPPPSADHGPTKKKRRR